MAKAIILLSGGLDSYVALDIASKKYNVVFALNFDYGQKAFKEENFALFKQKFTELVENAQIVSKEKEVIPLRLVDVNKTNLKIIQSFAPFGIEWNAPTFLVEHIDTLRLSYSTNQLHIMTNLGGGVKLKGFNFPKEEVSKNRLINIYGYLEEETYRNYTSVVFNIRKIEKYS